MMHFKGRPAVGCAAVAMGVMVALGLQACGGGSSSGSGDVRLVNATLTHASVDLLLNSAQTISATALDKASGYVALTPGSSTLQVNDTGASTALVLTAPTVVKDQHQTILVYESNGAVKTAFMAEEVATPTAGTAQLRVFDTAPDAGSVDVYVTQPGVDLASVASANYTISAATYAQSSAYQSFAPGTYQVRVTGAGNKGDLRLDMPQLVIADQQVVSIVVTPTAGGVLVNGSALVQQGAYTAVRNPNTRLRLVASVAGGGTVSASVGSRTVDSGTVSPSVGSYVLVPAASTPLVVLVNGAAVSVPSVSLVAGSDATLLVSGSATAASVAVLGDDNHLPSTTGNVKVRLVDTVNGLGGGLTLSADFSVLASNVQPGAASAYATFAGSTSVRLDVSSPLNVQPLYLQSGLNIPNDAVYSMFMVGDATAPVGVLRRDR